jgi:hypothetical protein
MPPRWVIVAVAVVVAVGVLLEVVVKLTLD